MAVQGVAVPAMWLAAEVATASANATSAAEAARAASDAIPKTGLTRVFADPYLELVRLLREATEVEHALMLQYLYCAFSVKPAYQGVAGTGDPKGKDLLGIAIQEMQHLGKVNQMLVALGAAPNLLSQDFPYEPDIYPFAFTLEPMSAQSLARYCYCEAPAGAMKRTASTNPKELGFLARLDTAFGRQVRPNHVGSFYDTIIATVDELQTLRATRPRVPDLAPWRDALVHIQREGDRDHYAIFRDLFLGVHPGFNGVPNAWGLQPDHHAYPARQVVVNPSGFAGHPGHIENPVALELAWLDNLHYWAVLFFLTHAYREDEKPFLDLARRHMLGPMWSLARHLPALGAGLPFDHLSMGYAPGRDQRSCLHFYIALLQEIDRLTQALKRHLPSDYPIAVSRASMQDLRAHPLIAQG
jgi:hypothetical protein